MKLELKVDENAHKHAQDILTKEYADEYEAEKKKVEENIDNIYKYN